MFKDDKREGNGLLFLQDGSSYFGEFKDDKVLGRGEMKYLDGTVEKVYNRTAADLNSKNELRRLA